MLRLRTALLLTIAFAVLAGVIAMRADRTSGSNVNPSAPWNVFFAGDFDGICFAELRLVGTTLAGTWDCGVFGAGSLSGPIEKSSQGWTFEVNGILTRAPALDFDMYVLGSISADATDIAGTWEAPLLGESGTFSGFRKGAPPPTATPSPTATPTPTSTPTVSPTPTISLTPTLSPTVTATSTASATLAPSSTPPPAATNTPVAPATPTPAPSVLGDVDCDGLVTSVDASLVLQYASGLLDSLPCLENGDINNNGQVNSVDAAIILTIVAGILPA